MSGVEKSELRTSVKVFITSDKKEALQEAIDKCKCKPKKLFFSSKVCAILKLGNCTIDNPEYEIATNKF